MGASSWAYFTPYQPDLVAALHALREDVFQRGAYWQCEAYWRDMTFEEFLPPDPTFTDDDRAEYRAEFARLQAREEPTSIESLLAWNDTDGTHSILDIDQIAPYARQGAAAPLDAAQLMTLFGTAQPTRALLTAIGEEALLEWLQKTAGRYHSMATYIIVYRDGQPDELMFTGYSGD